MYNFEGEPTMNKKIEDALQEVQDILNIVDVLARATGNFINSCGNSKEQCFSDHISSWLFDKKQGASFAAVRRQGRAKNQGVESTNGCGYEFADFSDEVGENWRGNIDVHVARRPDRLRESTFCTLGSSADGQNFATSYYTNQLISHNISSNAGYQSPRSRYLENSHRQVANIRQRLAGISSSSPEISACDLVGPIGPLEPHNTNQSKKCTPGVTVSISGKSYSNVKSCIDRSKSLFENFAGPSNPYYKSPLETNKTRLHSSRYRLI